MSLEINASIGVDTSGLVAGFKQAENQTDKYYQNLKRQISQISKQTERLKKQLATPAENLKNSLSTGGADANQKKIAEQILAGNELIKQRIKNEQTIKQTLEASKLEASQAGLTADQKQRLSLITAGATKQQLAEFDALKATTNARNQASLAMQKQNAQIKTMLTGLKTMAVALAGFSVAGVINSADSYTQLAARIKNVTDSEAEQIQVLKRLNENTKTTYRSLAEAGDSYLGISGSLKATGYNTNEILDFIDGLTFAFTANATTADKADSAIQALNKSFATGKVDSKAWTSLLLAIPTIAKDLSKELGISEDRVRELGITGKLSTNELANAFINARGSYKELADGMNASVKDALTYFKNSFSQFVGEANNGAISTQTLANGIKFLADNIKYLVLAVEAFAALKFASLLKNIVAQSVLFTTSIFAKTKAVQSETVAVLANTKAWQANQTAQLAGRGKLGLANKLGNVASGAMIGASVGSVAGNDTGVMAGAAVGIGTAIGGAVVGTITAGAVSLGELIAMAFGKKTETTASSLADKLVGGLAGMFGRDDIQGMGDLLFSFTKQGKDEYQQMLKNQAEAEKRKSEATKISQSKERVALLEAEKAYGEYVEELEKVKDAIGLTNEQLKIKELREKNLSEIQLKNLENLQQEIKLRENQASLKTEIENLKNQTERVVLSDRELAIKDFERLAGGDKDLLNEAIKAFDDLELKKATEQFNQSVLDFGNNVDRMNGDFNQFKRTDGTFDWLSMDFDTFNAWQKQQDAISKIERDKQISNYNQLRADGGFLSLEEKISRQNENLNKTIKENQMAFIEAIQKITPATPATITPATPSPSGFENQSLQNVGSLNIVLMSDAEKVAGKITGTTSFLTEFKRLFEVSANQWTNNLAIANYN